MEVSVDFKKIVMGRVDQGRMENTNKADLTLPTQQVLNLYPHTLDSVEVHPKWGWLEGHFEDLRCFVCVVKC